MRKHVSHPVSKLIPGLKLLRWPTDHFAILSDWGRISSDRDWLCGRFHFAIFFPSKAQTFGPERNTKHTLKHIVRTLGATSFETAAKSWEADLSSDGSQGPHRNQTCFSHGSSVTLSCTLNIEFPSNLLVDLRLLFILFMIGKNSVKICRWIEEKIQPTENGIFLEDPAYDNPRFMANGMNQSFKTNGAFVQAPGSPQNAVGSWQLQENWK